MSKQFNIPAASCKTKPFFGWDKPWLAPLAGYTDLPFRMLCRHFGATVCVTEMVSAAGLVMGSQPTADLLDSPEEEKELIVQLFGSTPEIMGEATAILRAKGWLWFDCNLGCPAKKVVRQGAGSRLLEDTDKIIAMASAMIAAARAQNNNYVNGNCKGMVGFKLRLGFEKGKNTSPDLALRLEDAGAGWITLHPRYGKQGFSGEADWKEIEILARRLSIPLLASGDLLTAAKGIECLKQTGASGLMYGRGALYDPAIFQKHYLLLADKPLPVCTRETLGKMILLHIELVKKYSTISRGFNKIRSILPRYARFHPGVGRFRAALSRCADWDSLINEVIGFVEQLDEGEIICG